MHRGIRALMETIRTVLVIRRKLQSIHLDVSRTSFDYRYKEKLNLFTAVSRSKIAILRGSFVEMNAKCIGTSSAEEESLG